jgi:hypothetical protein
MIGLNRSGSLAYSDGTRRRNRDNAASFQSTNESRLQELVSSPSRYYPGLISLGSGSMSMSMSKSFRSSTGTDITPSTVLMSEKESVESEAAATIRPRALVPQESRNAMQDDMLDDDDGPATAEGASFCTPEDSQSPTNKPCIKDGFTPKKPSSSSMPLSPIPMTLTTTNWPATPEVGTCVDRLLIPKQEEIQLPLSRIVKHISNHTLTTSNGSTTTSEGLDIVSKPDIESIISRPSDHIQMSDRGTKMCSLAVGVDVERPIGKVRHVTANHMTTSNLKKMMIDITVLLTMITLMSLYSISHEGLGHAGYLWILSDMGAVPTLLTNGEVTSQVMSKVGNDRKGLVLLQEECTINHDLVAPLQVQDSVPPKVSFVTVEAEIIKVIDGFAKPPSFNQSYHDQHREWFIIDLISLIWAKSIAMSLCAITTGGRAF